MTAKSAKAGKRADEPLAGRREGTASKAGRKAFKGFGPEGYRIRMMEPGEARRLLAIARRADATLIALGKTEIADAPKPSVGDFVRFLVDHEVFVAEKKRSGEAVGFAAAHATSELYWLSELSVEPDHGRRGIGSALVSAVLERARWFRHSGVGLTTYTDVPVGASFYRRLGFDVLPDADCPPRLLQRKLAETPGGSRVTDRCVMTREV
ncbi:GNAT family N-acetyltransferase [Jiella avicenniae]|uniref:GNAT family N-acetyltransferase n=1 Tax=Jiella avicenniae TaxID=2907202 RepID=A0A9X1P7G3_9HYPH|nr:GNAT family N-acetyltransferase [Jiella avicenniae]MCE7030693.1 GNAT family N-acetyltransferase [Jiella avicenniae]